MASIAFLTVIFHVLWDCSLLGGGDAVSLQVHNLSQGRREVYLSVYQRIHFAHPMALAVNYASKGGSEEVHKEAVLSSMREQPIKRCPLPAMDAVWNPH